jgi:signal peptidase I
MEDDKKNNELSFSDGTADEAGERAEANDAAKTEGQGFDFAGELYDWAQALVYSIVFIVVLFTFLVRIIGVDGESMEPTLHNNDKIVITNLFYSPKQGDVIVLRKKSFLEEPIVKRVIATEGQTVNIDFISHKVWVDGVLLDEPYIKAPIAKAGDVVFPVTVPKGFIFVLGDNRNNSADSRLTRVGMIDMRYVLGHVIYRVFPFDNIGGIG